MPADVARRMGGEVVIAVDVMGGFEDGVLLQSLGGHRLVPGRLLHIAADAQRALSIMMAHLYEYKSQGAQPDVILHPAIGPGIGIFGGFTRLTEIIAAGEAATEAALPQIRQTIERARRRSLRLPQRDPAKMRKPDAPYPSPSSSLSPDR